MTCVHLQRLRLDIGLGDRDVVLERRRRQTVEKYGIRGGQGIWQKNVFSNTAIGRIPIEILAVGMNLRWGNLSAELET